MQHRHLTSQADWSKAAIDSVLDRGSLPEWRELFAAARADLAVATRVLEVAISHQMPGVLPIVERIVLRNWPNLNVVR